MESIYSSSSSATSLIDGLLEVDCCQVKMDNPFFKKYLISGKNKELEDYALYSNSYLGQDTREGRLGGRKEYHYHAGKEERGK